MIGVSASTGRELSGADHLRQSIADILTTPLGSRVMRRDYGSLLPELVDQPFNDATRLRLFGATALALMRWEPRIRLIRVQLFRGDSAGAYTLEIDGVLVDSTRSTDYTRLTIPLRYRSH
ncbi:MAG: GPW/gp25 family protein [Xanthomonadales bacterium]|nr:GPW/gp25 family protein [Xanthomonadales bacterium]